MIKKLKLNIKNAQLAEALGQSKPTKATKSAASEKKSPSKKATSKAPEGEDKVKKAKIIKSAKKESVKKEEAEPEIKKEVAPVEPAPAQEEEVVEEAPPKVRLIKAKEMEKKEKAKEQAKPVIRESFSQRADRMAKEKAEKFKPAPVKQDKVRLGPTGKHMDDIKAEAEKKASEKSQRPSRPASSSAPAPVTNDPEVHRKAKPSQGEGHRTYDRREVFSKQYQQTRGMGRRSERGRIDTNNIDEGGRWRKRRPVKRAKASNKDLTVRPTSLKVRLPITVKDLANEMKLKASQLIAKLFMQGATFTLNDLLDDETTVQLLGQEFECEITVDTSEEERIRITPNTTKEEIQEFAEEELVERPPVVAFMGHVDHGKTSLIDAIRKSNRVSGEAGAITQHIGAFSCTTDFGDLTVLDTPGHEAFNTMRERGAQITDVIVLVIAGDEGIKPQTDEAIKHAQAVGATIVVALNKCDKPGFDADEIYRQLSERELLPEAWGGQTITVNCSATTGEGIKALLEMIALQSEVLELSAHPSMRARGTVIEAEMHKGQGAIATVLVQNGLLRHGDCLVFGITHGRIRTMRDEHGNDVESVSAGRPVFITGLSGLPEAGEEFIVVKNEREAREIAEARAHEHRTTSQQKKRLSIEHLLAQAGEEKKVFDVILKADVQGSLEALRVALLDIKSDKINVNVVAESIGEVSESDVELAAASGAVIVGFHTEIENHAIDFIKQLGVQVKIFDVIYHAVEAAKEMMIERLDKIPEEVERGEAEVRAVFKSSQLGLIAGCLILDGKIERKHHARLVREGEILWKGPIASLKRGNDDAKEVPKGIECGILLKGYKDIKEEDRIQAFDIIYRTQTL